jgi:phage shock protein E
MKFLIRLATAVLLTASAAHAQLADNAVWIDVRSYAEYQQGHLEGASLIPFDGIEKGVMKLGLEKSQPIYLYCGSGKRAETARERLQAMGYSAVTNVGGLHDAQALAATSDQN